MWSSNFSNKRVEHRNRYLKYILLLFFLIYQCSTEPELSRDDYFPLKIGNSWEYTFNRQYRDDWDQNSSDTRGVASIKVVSKKKQGNEIIYELDIHKEGSTIYKDLNISTGEQTIDTTYINIDGTITFIEDSDGYIRTDSYQLFFGFKLPRFASDESDVLTFHAPYTTYTMEKNTGIISYAFDSYHNWSGSWGSWILESCDLK